jgi:toxin ParE1/3/4
MRFRFHPEALEEYQEAVNWYAQSGNPSALRFVEALEDSIRRIVEAPERWRVIEEDVRRCLTKVFPYGVLYTIEPESLCLLSP